MDFGFSSPGPAQLPLGGSQHAFIQHRARSVRSRGSPQQAGLQLAERRVFERVREQVDAHSAAAGGIVTRFT